MSGRTCGCWLSWEGAHVAGAWVSCPTRPCPQPRSLCGPPCPCPGPSQARDDSLRTVGTPHFFSTGSVGAASPDTSMNKRSKLSD